MTNRFALLLLLLTACSTPARELADLAGAQPEACESDADCCVVTDGCLAHAYVVAKPDYARAQELARLSEDSDVCVGCIAPRVDVRCNATTLRCEGREIAVDAPEAPGLSPDHCGSVLTDPWAGDPELATFGCGGE